MGGINMDDSIEKLYRQKLAIATFCRSYLYFYDFISDKENEKIHNKIKKWQDKNKIHITRAQLDNVDVIYNDNIKEE